MEDGALMARLMQEETLDKADSQASHMCTRMESLAQKLARKSCHHGCHTLQSAIQQQLDLHVTSRCISLTVVMMMCTTIVHV